MFCSVMGRAGEFFGIGLYAGYEALSGLYELAVSPVEELDLLKLESQDCLMCYFGSRDEVEAEDREVYKRLGLRFQGAHNWIYFRSFSPGCFPWFLDGEQAELAAETLVQLAGAYRDYSEGAVPVDFRGGELLERRYDQKQEAWTTGPGRAPRFMTVPVLAPFEDAKLLKQLKAKKRTKDTLLMEICYLPMPIQERRGKRPYFPQVLLMAENRSAAILGQQYLSPGEDAAAAAQELLCGYILEHGLPASVQVRGKRMAARIEMLCGKAGIPLVQGKEMPLMDRIIEGLFSFISSQ